MFRIILMIWYIIVIKKHNKASKRTASQACRRLRWHDIKGWEKVVLWFDGIREPAEGSNYW